MFNTFSQIGVTVMRLPKNGLSSLWQYYKRYHANPENPEKKDETPILLVAIYNTEQLAEQLATEIVKHLKDGANDRSEGDNDSKESPTPT